MRFAVFMPKMRPKGRGFESPSGQITIFTKKYTRNVKSIVKNCNCLRKIENDLRWFNVSKTWILRYRLLSAGTFGNFIGVQKQGKILRVLKFEILRVDGWISGGGFYVSCHTIFLFNTYSKFHSCIVQWFRSAVNWQIFTLQDNRSS
jgi:hypothetical protein